MAEMLSPENVQLGDSVCTSGTFFYLWTKVHQISFIQRGRGCVAVDEIFFQLLDMYIRSGDIRDQSQKLSEIASKFGLFWPS